MVFTMFGCGKKKETEGEVFHIYAWNEEFKGFFEKYFAEKNGDDYYVNGAKVVWTIVPSDNGAYQDALDEALLNQENAKPEDKVDMFLAESDYIVKYTHSSATQDVTKIGVTDFSNTYKYTVEAASDENGVVKGVSFQCCPAAVIYRRSIAKDLFGTDDPAEVQARLDSWEKFDEVAAQAKAKGYYMTASYAETYRTFSNNTSGPWVDANNNLVIDAAIQTWMDQSEKYVKEGYTLTEGVWDAGKTDQMFADGKTFTFFGPAWYYNFCMTNAQDAEKGCYGDWAICQGPQAYFWGGTWLLAATGSDNNKAVADTMNAFINNEEIAEKLIRNEGQFTNNQVVNNKIAQDPSFGNNFLGGQNDTALYVELAKNIKFQNQTNYDQLCNEGLQTQFVQYLKGTITKDEAMTNFYKYINEKYPNVVTPQ